MEPTLFFAPSRLLYIENPSLGLLGLCLVLLQMPLWPLADLVSDLLIPFLVTP